jgi:hypothetical protein
VDKTIFFHDNVKLLCHGPLNLAATDVNMTIYCLQTIFVTDKVKMANHYHFQIAADNLFVKADINLSVAVRNKKIYV